MVRYRTMRPRVVDLLERRAGNLNDEAVAEVLPLLDGGIAVVTEMDGEEVVWEFDQDQAAIFIKALVLAYKSRQSVKIVQPLFRSAA